jgi:hypothetical protein
MRRLAQEAQTQSLRDGCLKAAKAYEDLAANAEAVGEDDGDAEDE